MYGWQIPPTKEAEQEQGGFCPERREKVASIKQGLLKSERIKHALLKLPRGPVRLSRRFHCQ